MSRSISLPAVAPVCTPDGHPAYAKVVDKAPRASVIIVNHNGRDYVKNCLHSLLNHDQGGYEIILADNASTDGSAGYVERHFPQVRVIRSDTNGGFGQGNNLGAQWAKGEYLAFLNPDTVVEPGWLEALIVALETDPQAGLATSKILLLADPKRINTCGNEIHFSGLTMCRGMGMDGETFSELEEVAAISGAAFVMRKGLFEALGGFDEDFFLYMEDTDLSWRARLAGYKCLCVPSSVVYHDYSLRFGPTKSFFQERNRYLMLLKGLRWRTLLLLLPALVLAEVVTWGFVLLREQQPSNKLRAYAWIVRHWGEVMEDRRRVQTMRRVDDRDLLSRCTHRLAFEQTGGGLVVRLAHAVFDPLFLVLQELTLGLMRW
jgi:GT2 family glycosyltransferase